MEREAAMEREIKQLRHEQRRSAAHIVSLQSIVDLLSNENVALRSCLEEVVVSVECPMCMYPGAGVMFDCGHVFCGHGQCGSTTVTECPACDKVIQQRTALPSCLADISALRSLPAEVELDEAHNAALAQATSNLNSMTKRLDAAEREVAETHADIEHLQRTQEESGRQIRSLQMLLEQRTRERDAARLLTVKHRSLQVLCKEEHAMMQEKWKEQSVQQQNALNRLQLDLEQSTQVEKRLAQIASLLRDQVVSRCMLQLSRPEPGGRGEAKRTSLESEMLKGLSPLAEGNSPLAGEAGSKGIR